MKHLKATLPILALAILISACDLSGLTESDSRYTTTEGPTEQVTVPTEIIAPTEITEPIEVIEPTEPALSAELPYLQKIKRGDQPIYNGPSYDNMQVGTVEKSGTYTIVQEQIDEEGNLWGKLKSGAGWVDLTQIKEENSNAPLVTASIPSKTLLQSGQYHHCIADTSEYMVQVALRIRETVTNIAIYDVVLNGDDEYLSELFTLDSWNPDMPIVADVTFPGPGSLYEIHFTDSAGVRHRYTISESGRNGEIDISAWSILD